jgi:hypothetical protein
MKQELTKQDEQEIKESVNENISQEHSLTTGSPNQALVSPIRGIGIKGMEDVPASMMAVPFVRLIQPTSQKTEDSKGQETLPGNFLYNDTGKAVGSIDFALLRAKVGNVTFRRESGDVTVTRLSILGCSIPDNKLFVITLSPTSYLTFGKIISQFKDAGVKESWRFLLTLTSEKRENEKGKFYVAKFQIGEELGKNTIAEMEKKFSEYGVVLDRSDVSEEEYLGK